MRKGYSCSACLASRCLDYIMQGLALISLSCVTAHVKRTRLDTPSVQTAPRVNFRRGKALNVSKSNGCRTVKNVA